jgi:hypothetical protein
MDDQIIQGVAPDSNSNAQQGLEQAPSAEPQVSISDAQQGIDYEQKLRAMQSEKDKIFAQNLALQNQMLQIQQSQIEKSQPQVQTNPYDYYQDPINHNKWEIWKSQQDLLPQIDARAEQKLMGMLENLYEQNFTQQHPDIDMNAVKNFAKLRRIGNLDDAYTLMNLQNNIQNVQRDTINSTFNQMKNNGAAPLRNTGSSVQVQPKLSFVDTLQRVEKDPHYLETLPKQVQEDFYKELTYRASLK